MTDVYFTIGEKEAIQKLQEVVGLTYIEAVNQMIDRKKELLEYYKRVGYKEMVEQLKGELGED